MPLNLKPLLKDLTNTLILSLYWLGWQYKYPLEIIPKKNFFKSIDFNSIKESLNPVLVRRSNYPSELETFTKLGTLKEQAILKQDIPGMSLFLLGGLFKIEDIYYRQKGKGDSDWSGEKIFFCDYKKNDDYEELESAIPIYFNFNDLNAISFPYEKSGNEAKKFANSLGLKPTSIDGTYLFTGNCNIKHVPVNLNYWHVELVLFDIEKKPIEDTKKKWSASAISQALGQITSIAFQITPSIGTIPDNCFRAN